MQHNNDKKKEEIRFDNQHEIIIAFRNLFHFVCLACISSNSY